MKLFLFTYSFFKAVHWIILAIADLAVTCKADLAQTNASLSFSASVRPYYLYRKDGKPGRAVMVAFKGQQLKEAAMVKVECEGVIEESRIHWDGKGLDSMTILLPAGAASRRECLAHITISTATNYMQQTILVAALRQWTVYIYPHSHVDIGYTNLQEVVEKLHVRNIEVGIDIAKRTANYPAGARFVWNPEATWVVSSYLKKASAEQKASFIAAVKKGWIQIDGAHSNINTSTCSDEELLRIFQNKNEIELMTGVPITTMVQMDNPGASWGLVQAAAQNGIRGFFSFPNYFDLRNKWENKPFYWMSEDGKSRLFYLQATSYGYGFRAKGRKYGLGKIQAFTDRYDRLSTNDPTANFIDPFIFEEIDQLEKEGSPYDIYAMTWSMADNCLIDADLPQAVKLWNEKYAYPKLIIAGSKEILAAYESRFKDIIPTRRGDLTEFWTEGLGSDARRVGIGRMAKENLVQAETLWPIIQNHTQAPITSYDEAWENLLLSAEHTWGYQNPAAPLAKEVEANKAAYFEDAAKQSQALIDLALKPVAKEGGNGIAVINTLSWPRVGLVTLSATQSKIGDRVVNDKSKEVLSQRLSTGELVFLTDTIAALCSGFYKILPGKANASGRMISGTNRIQNALISVTIDDSTGDIKRFIDLQTKHQYVDTTSFFSVNSYNYLPGVKNGKPVMAPGKISNATGVTIKVKEDGPLVASFVVTSKAESCHWLTREVSVVKNQRYIKIVNTIDKIATRKKEGIHYGFAFNIPDGKIRMDIPLGVMTPEKDQVKYSNKNWFTFQRWIDVSNKDYGITWTALEAPVVEFGNITGNILDGARQAEEWVKKVPETQTIISWPINNHWDTNFPLEQGGIITSTYMLLTYAAPYDPVVANRFGVEQNRPLIAIGSAKNPIHKPLVSLSNPHIMISAMEKSEDNKAIILRLRSLSEKPEELVLTWPAEKPKSIVNCSLDEIALNRVRKKIKMRPYGLSTIRAEF